jgi:CMP-N,N'-diacetyllegionaminic acid synthase
MILVYIPARGGSKGIPLKNLFPLNGKPLIEYTFEIVIKLMDEFGDLVFPFLSTDDDRIAEFGNQHGLITEYKRPHELADDKSTIVDGLLHAVNWLNEKKSIMPDAILLLQPTSPMRDFAELKSMINLFLVNNSESMFSVIPMKQHPYECIVKNENEWNYLAEPIYGQQRQNYKENYYFIDGSYYLVNTKFLEDNKAFIISERSVPFVLQNKFIIDIDEDLDLKLAEVLMRKDNE